MIKTTSLLLIVLISFSGCFHKDLPVTYTSPFDMNANFYHAIPLKSDSIKSAVYTDFAFTGGSANSNSDNLFAFHGGAHQSFNFGKFQAWYGGQVALGSYSVKDNYRLHYSDSSYTGGVYTGYRIDTLSHVPPSRHSFGAYGLNGGFNYVLPFRHKHGEWRFGIQVDIQKEFGDYLSFRKSLPDTLADFISTNRWTEHLGFSTEWIRRKRTVEIGYQFAIGVSFSPPGNYYGDSNSSSAFYVANTFHMTKGKITGFCQLNAAPNAVSFKTGINYRLGKKNKNNDRK